MIKSYLTEGFPKLFALLAPFCEPLASRTSYCESALSRTPIMCGIAFVTRLTINNNSNANTKENGDVLRKKKGQRLYCCRYCAIHGPIHHEAKMTFHNFAEVNFRDFLLTGTGVEIGTNDRFRYTGCPND